MNKPFISLQDLTQLTLDCSTNDEILQVIVSEWMSMPCLTPKWTISSAILKREQLIFYDIVMMIPVL